MDKSFFILVGANPLGVNNNPGGQLAASRGLYDYAISQGHHLEVIDTLQASFPVPSLYFRLRRGLKRIYGLLYLFRTKQVKGVILFSAAGFSFYERSMMAGLCRLYRVKSIFFMRSGFFVSDLENNRVRRVIAKFLLKLPNVIGIQGEGWRSFYQKLGVSKDSMVMIRNWLTPLFDGNVSTIKLRKDEVIRFCFVGWLVQEKGVNELLEAIMYLAKRYDFEFIFVGGGTLESALRQAIGESELSSRVHVTGWADPDEVKRYLSESHVFVLPSKAEGFPNALLEAMALGLPAICTNVGAVSDSLFNDINGYLLEHGDAVSVARAMERYLKDSNLVHRHSGEALKIVEQQHNRETNCKLLFEQLI